MDRVQRKPQGGWSIIFKEEFDDFQPFQPPSATFDEKVKKVCNRSSVNTGLIVTFL